ncbi:MAG TPA: STAS domain-containing protein [Bryobacteraceae bacterium]|jgi:anti-sigma B factor antagonist|nr:STAS domain-containing protein [Bryobacteraceae bacterium]
MSLKLTIRQVGDVAVIDLSGRITLGEGSSAIRDEIHDLIASGSRKILMNLADVSYIDSSGIGELVADFTSMANAGGALKLLGLSKGTKMLLKVTKLDSIFDVHEEEAEALGSFA